MSDEMPITCDEALRLLASFLDGELQVVTRDRVEHHLEICRACFSRAEFERRLKTELGRLGREEISPGFQQRIQLLVGSFHI